MPSRVLVCVTLATLMGCASEPTPPPPAAATPAPVRSASRGAPHLRREGNQRSEPPEQRELRIQLVYLCLQCRIETDPAGGVAARCERCGRTWKERFRELGFVELRVGNLVLTEPRYFEQLQDPQKAPVWTRLAEELRAVRARLPDDGEARLPVIIDASPQVTHGLVVRTLDEVVRAGFRHVSFAPAKDSR